MNDPDIVLADEPTGALDTETGIQVMELLKEIARDRLVVMVTHNPELAEEYATRIIRLRDGRIVDDTNPIGEQDEVSELAQDRSDATRHSSMGFLTALALSFNNLMTKKGRTFMTAFAGSIGIIGIAAILALSNGVNDYIAKTEEEALSSYPLTITKSSFSLSSLMMADMVEKEDKAKEDEGERVIPQSTVMADMFAQVKNNDLRSFKKFLDGGDSGIEPYVSSIQYSYGLSPQIYKKDTSKGVVRLNPSRMGQTLTNGLSGSAFLGGSSMSSFTELLSDQKLLDQSLELVEGRWPKAYDECVFVLGRDGHITDYTLYSLGFYDTKVMDDMTTKALNGETVEVPDVHETFTLDDAMGMHFAVVPACDLYQRNEEQNTWTDMTGDKDYMRRLIRDAIDLHVVGVVQRAENASSSGVSEGIGYTQELTFRLMDEAADSKIVQQQRNDEGTDVFTGKTFEELQDEESRNFDMESVFSVDEEALKEAFTFDTSALDGMGEGMDFSGMDLDLGSSMGDVDFSNMQIDSSQMASIFGEESMAQIMAGAPQFSFEDVEVPPEQMEVLNQVGNELATDFMSWMMLNGKFASQDTDFGALLQEYLQTENAQKILSKLSENEAFAGDTNAAEQIVNDVMSDYLTNKLGPYLSEALGSLMQQAAQVMATQLAQQMAAQMAAMSGQIGSQIGEAISSQLSGQMEQLSSAMQDGFKVDADAFSRAIKFNMTQEDLTSLLSNYMNADDLSYEGNMSKLGFAERESPESVSVFPVDFEAKEAVLDIIDGYNDRKTKDGKDDATIEYSDIAGVLMSSVTDIVNTISLVLIAFVSISLVVSSIMISIITYISVLERKKEIGILRAMGASKLNVANIFNAETVIEGFFAGVLAVSVVYAVSVPVNEIVYRLKDVPNIMQLPTTSALALVGVSVGLTLIAGLIPSSAAARRDPVEALRSE